MAATTTDPASLAQMLSLLINAMKTQNQSPGNSPAANGGKYNGPANNVTNTIPSADESDESLQNWFSQNQGRTVYDAQGNPSTLGWTGGSAPSQGGSYDESVNNQYGSGGSPEPGTIRAWINQPNGILNGASFENPLVTQAEQLLQNYQSTASNANSTLTPKTPSPTQSPPPTPPTATYNPQATQANVPVIPMTPTALPSTPTTVPANNPQAVTDMIGANAAQALSNPSLTASIGQMGVPSQAGSSSQSLLNSIAPIMRKYQSNQNTTPQISMAQAAQYQTPGGTTQDLGSVDAAPVSGAVNAPALGAGGANYANGGLDASGYTAGADGTPTVGSVSGNGLTGQQQAAGIGSSVGALISSIGKMFTPGVPGVPSMPNGVPLSQFKPPTVS
jgi:hypothetical protein